LKKCDANIFIAEQSELPVIKPAMSKHLNLMTYLFTSKNNTTIYAIYLNLREADDFK